MTVQEGTTEFLSRLRALDISLKLEDGRLRVSAPRDVLTPKLREELAERKAEILAFLGDTAKLRRSGERAIERVPRDGSLPLSSAQSRLWFLDQLNPGGTAYILPMHTRVRGQLDVAALERTLNELTERHEILRTVFPPMDGSPCQVIQPPSPSALPLVSLLELPADEREATALRMAAAEVRRPFDLAEGPLFRAKLLRLGPEDHVLLLSVHHIVFDGSSIEVFWHELAAIYCAFHAGNPSPLPDPVFQYVDFASWQKRSLEGAVRQSHLKYWKQQLGENPPVLDLATDRPRRYAPGCPGAKKALQLDSSLCASLRALSRREGVSLSMTFLAAFNILLHRLAGQEDILVGMPVARRARADFERIIGIFVNTIVVRTRFPGPLTFLEVLAQVRNTMLDAFEHQDMPFEDLVGALDPHRDLSRTPLFQVFFNHLNMRLTPVQIPGLQVEPFSDFEVESKFDLTLYLYEQGESISLLLVYNTQLFDADRASILLEQYAALLKQISNDPLRPVTGFSLVTGRAQNTLLPDPGMPLEDRWHGLAHSGFLKWAARAPDRIAVVDEGSSWTYRQLDEVSSGAAAWLRARGVGSGDTVAIYAHRSAPLVAAILGILRSGAAFLVLDPAYPAFRLANCLRIVRPKAWLEIAAAGRPPEELETAIRDIAGEHRLTISHTPDTAFAEAGGEAWDPDDSDRPAYATFTSGTTGEPKCVVGTHGPISHFLDWHVRQFDLKHTDRFSMLSGLAHDPVLRDIFTPLWIGGTLVIPSAEDIFVPGRLSQWMKEQGITVAHLTPAMATLLGQASGRPGEKVTPVSSLRYAFIGGDILTSRDAAQLAGIAPNACCVGFYGATETPQAMAWCRVRPAVSASGDAASATPIPIGSAIADAQLLVLNRAGNLAGVGELGEIYVRTPYLSQGYSNDEALTRSRFLKNPFTGREGDRLYKTGDLGRYRPDGLVTFAGRADQQIKIRGYRVEPGEVEAAVSNHPGVRDCAVVATDGPSQQKRLVAYIVERAENRVEPRALQAFLGKLLPDYLIPSEFHVVPSIPLTPNGKLDRRALAAGTAGLRSLKERIPPRNRVEASIAEIWSRVLGREDVNVFDNFFELGGNSLAVVQLAAQLRSTFHIDFPLQTLFLEPTIAGLAGHLEYDPAAGIYRCVSAAPDWKCLVSAQPTGTRVPFFFVAGYQGPDDTLLVLSRFAPFMGPDQPVFGFRPRWIDGDGEAYKDVGEAAREFVAELRAVQPAGPYLLGGYCVGGVIAVEMGRQLIEAGEKVALLALLDSEHPSAYRALLANFRLICRRTVHMGEVIAGVIRSNGQPRWANLRDLIRRKLPFGRPAKSTPADGGLYENKVNYRRLAYNHSLQEYPGRITLIVNDQQYQFDRCMGWKHVARGGLVVHRLPGDHNTVLTVYGRQFAALLAKCIDQGLSESSHRLNRIEEGIS